GQSLSTIPAASQRSSGSTIVQSAVVVQDSKSSSNSSRRVLKRYASASHPRGHARGALSRSVRVQVVYCVGVTPWKVSVSVTSVPGASGTRTCVITKLLPTCEIGYWSGVVIDTPLAIEVVKVTRKHWKLLVANAKVRGTTVRPCSSIIRSTASPFASARVGSFACATGRVSSMGVPAGAGKGSAQLDDAGSAAG